jgi:hypothetical protein
MTARSSSSSTRKQLAVAMLASTLLAGPGFPAAPDELLDTVLVTGEQPGPGLWKVSKGDHVMWVLATYGSLPRGMTWRSRQVEARIAESQEVLFGGNAGIRPDLGMLRAMTMISAAARAGKNPDGASLRQVLPPELFARWLVLREKYVGEDDDIEEWRPVIALGQLRRKAMEKQGLQGGASVDAYVGAAAKKYKARVHRLKRVERVVRMEDPRGMMRATRNVEAPDLACFARNLSELELDIERTTARANAWARGDIVKLRELQHSWKIQDDCGYVWLAFGDRLLFVAAAEGDSAEAARVKKLIADYTWHEEWARVQARQEWLAAAQAALAKNKSTFAVLRLDDVFSPDGALEKLRKLGYAVEDPL